MLISRNTLALALSYEHSQPLLKRCFYNRFEVKLPLLRKLGTQERWPTYNYPIKKIPIKNKGDY